MLIMYKYTMQRRDIYGAWEQYLGLEHSDTTPKRSYAVNHVSVFNHLYGYLAGKHHFRLTNYVLQTGYFVCLYKEKRGRFSHSAHA